MEKAKLVWMMGMAQGFFYFCMLISVFTVAGKTYSEPAFEGKGTQRLFKVDYGVSCQGIFTAFVGAWLTYWHHQAYVHGGEMRINVLFGALILICVMTLQTGIIWGDMAGDIADLAKIDHGIIQGCSQSDYNVEKSGNCEIPVKDGACCPVFKYNDDGTPFDPNCINAALEGQFSGYLREYSGNKHLKGGSDSTVAWAVFACVTQIVEIVVMWTSMAELRSGGGGGGGGEDGTYQRL